jgi:hypothetical protein
MTENVPQDDDFIIELDDVDAAILLELLALAATVAGFATCKKFCS